MRENKKKGAKQKGRSGNQFSEKACMSPVAEKQTQPRIIKSTHKKPCMLEPSIPNGISLLKEEKLDEAELCLQAVLDQAAKEQDLNAQCEARYYLAKLNKEMGDLTLACEHWQIARDLYKQSGNSTKIEEIEKYMRENGCPTDWVLNGF